MFDLLVLAINPSKLLSVLEEEWQLTVLLP